MQRGQFDLGERQFFFFFYFWDIYELNFYSFKSNVRIRAFYFFFFLLYKRLLTRMQMAGRELNQSDIKSIDMIKSTTNKVRRETLHKRGRRKRVRIYGIKHTRKHTVHTHHPGSG